MTFREWNDIEFKFKIYCTTFNLNVNQVEYGNNQTKYSFNRVFNQF